MYRHKVGGSWIVGAILALCGVALAVSAVPSPAFAQAPAGATAAAKPGTMEHPAEEIVVTGTRIGRSNLEEYAPIAVVSSEDIARSGVTTVEQLLFQLPNVTLNGISRNDNNGGNGLAFVDLRNMGPGRTLVLVDGKRFVNSSSSVTEAVDLNNIPITMIDRVEVLLDGASAVYGSDAIGGVVNIILKHDFEGLELYTYGGVSDHSDGEEGEIAATYGAKSDRGNVTVNATYAHRGEIKQRDRDWSKKPVVAAFFNDDGSVGEIFGSSYVGEGRVGGAVFLPDPATGASFQPLTADLRYNYGKDQWLSGGLKRFSFTALGDYDITKDLKGYLEGSYTNRTSRNVLAPQPLGGSTTFHPNGFLMPTTNPYIPADFLATLDPGTEFISMNRRMVDVGNRIYDVEANTFRVLSGFKGKVLDNYDWDVFFNYGRNDNAVTILNSINLTRVLQTVDPALCAANAELGCVVGNYFGPRSVQPEVVDYISYTDVETQGLRELQSGASVSGRPLKLPYGDLGIAAGVEFRDESGFDRPSAVVVHGDSAGNGQDPTAGSYNVTELYGELSIPVLAGLPVANDLTLDLAGRWSDYNTFGSDETYRVGLSYAPLKDVRFRGIVATAFRAPGISDLFGGATDSYEVISDPCNDWDTDPNVDPIVKANCQAAGVPPGYNMNNVIGDQVRANIGGNPKLGAENATVYNLGIVLTPTFLEGFSLTGDFYNIQVENAITNPDSQNVISSCYESPGLSSPNCQFVGRDPVTGAPNKLIAVKQNIGKLDERGVDFTLEYLFDLERVGLNNIGKIDLAWQGNYLLEDSNIINGIKTHNEGTISANLGAATAGNFRWLQTTSFIHGNWQLSNIIRYMPAASVFGFDPKVDPFSEVDSTVYWDLVGQITLDRWSFTAGINNVAGTEPPFLLEGGTNAPAEGYDFVGRFFFGSVSLKL